MMELNVSKRTMMRLIREHKDQIGVPIPQPNCKEVRFTEEENGDYTVAWEDEYSRYRFALGPDLILRAYITEKCQIHATYIGLDRDWLTGLGILPEREEGLVCQG